MNDNRRQDKLSAAFSDVETIIGGHLMRPLSLATYDVMLRTGNPLASGSIPDEGTPELTQAIIAFVFTHAAPWPDVARASFDNQAFREAALIFCGDLTPADFQVAMQSFAEQTSQLQAAQTEVIGETGGKKHGPATSRDSSQPKCSR